MKGPLHDRLLAAMAPRRIFTATAWGDPQAMSRILRDIRKHMSNEEGPRPEDDALKASLRRFATTQQVENFTQLRHVCHGLSVPIGENKWRLIDREPLFERLIGLVDEQGARARQFRSCYYALLNGYFGFDKHQEQQASGKGTANWTRLRGFLDERLTPVIETSTRRGTTPEWLTTLSAHRNLLTAEPCTRYAQDLRRGAPEELKTLCGVLGIPGTSWVWDEALMAYVRAVCEGDDLRFKREMEGVLRLVNGEKEMRLAEMHSIRATTLAVIRYSRCNERPEHEVLRDTSINLIGNPWIERTKWDAQVNDEPARQMVDGWLKRGLIGDFFKLLAHEGNGDLRRLNYWLKWAPHITDMWFVLGGYASGNRSEQFASLRKRMGSRRRALGGSTSRNNAFVMRIGPLLAIEFGEKGNACYVFAASEFKANLDKQSLSIHELRQRDSVTRLGLRLPHLNDWEVDFDDALRDLLQSIPEWNGELPDREESSGRVGGPVLRSAFSSPSVHAPAPAHPISASQALAPARPAASNPSQTPAPDLPLRSEAPIDRIRERCDELGIAWEDNRPKGGAFWVLLTDRSKHTAFGSVLLHYGFKFSPVNGFWLRTGD